MVFPCVASKSAVEVSGGVAAGSGGKAEVSVAVVMSLLACDFLPPLQVRFYSLHSKLDTSQYLYTLNMLSPLAKINLHGNHLLVLTTNGTLFIYHLSLNMEPQTSGRSCPLVIIGGFTSFLINTLIGATLKISKYYEASLSQSVPRVHLAISAMTSTLRAEPNKTLDPGVESGSEEDLESVLLNMSGKILMIHRISTVTTETGRKKVRPPLLQRTVSTPQQR